MQLFENVTTLLIDLDDTVFDFKKAEHVALSAALLEVGINPTDEVVQCYSDINTAIWKELERGEITRDELRVERFRRFYRAKDIEMDPAVLADIYVEKLAVGHYWINGSREALQELGKRFRLYIASNGSSRIQRSRINSSDLESLVDGIFISEEVGVNKPALGFFEHCLDKIGAKAEECIMIGDSLSSDIAGGITAGLKTIWINPKHKENKTEVKADLDVTDLAELVNLI